MHMTQLRQVLVKISDFNSTIGTVFDGGLHNITYIEKVPIIPAHPKSPQRLLHNSEGIPKLPTPIRNILLFLLSFSFTEQTMGWFKLTHPPRRPSNSTSCRLSNVMSLQHLLSPTCPQ
ncbi:hypothetical protein KC19_7G093400 [Ceratodon purpureus]|uniref:Uncharacterized protein n=1 Tax=Ceratodon purpureus TaxID=3225 RepID=A0A8T0HCQ4_CERPU|nr:hypothetical protein KC19_7G093400 [Ceratodon purpureus]